MSNASKDPDKRSPPRPDAAPPSKPSMPPKAQVDLAEESIAGEEDPGASLDLSVDPPAVSPKAGKMDKKAGRAR